MIKLAIIVILFCTGCTTLDIARKNGKVYITTDVMPTITNDKSFGDEKGTHHRIIINGKIQYRIVHTF